MIFCSECGAKNKDMAKFCRVCGADMRFDEDEEFNNEVVNAKPVQKAEAKKEVPAEEKPSQYKNKDSTTISESFVKAAPIKKVKEEYYEDEPEKEPEVAEEKPSAEEEYYEDETSEYTIEDEPKSESEEEEYYEDDPVEEEDFDTSSSIASNPANDSYWNDVVPEIEEEIYKIPKDIILKFVFGGLAIIALVIILICAL